MYQKLIIVGNLTRDVEIRYLPSGQAVAKSGIATSRKWKDQSGQQKEETLFIDITIWGRSAEIANQYLHKGSNVLIEGRLTLEQWIDNSGQKRSKHSVTVESLKMLDSKPQGGQVGGQAYNQGGQVAQPQYQQPAQQQQQQQYRQPSAQPASQPQQPQMDMGDEEIPF